MKKLFTLSLAVLALAGCNDITKDSFESALLVTGSISDSQNTRVALSLEDDILKQRWEVGDHIVGSYGSGTDIVDVDYKVKTVKSDGSAVFEKVGDFADPEEGTTVYVLCLGQKDEYVKSYEGYTDQAYWADCKTVMTSSATVSSNCLEFSFRNEAAVIGIPQFVALGVNSDYVMDFNLVVENEVSTSFVFSNGDIRSVSESSHFSPYIVELSRVPRVQGNMAIIDSLYFTIPAIDDYADINLTVRNKNGFYSTSFASINTAVTAGTFVNLGNVERNNNPT